ncbi:hypothetical protein AB6A40_003411 [Gnathostoma spinigerum]|uniref:Uncharacterized protein n=1 Tax=Gnathostoma spinigerum TaxID=75299 RepID=A0ABD6EJG7_9BILA
MEQQEITNEARQNMTDIGSGHSEGSTRSHDTSAHGESSDAQAENCQSTKRALSTEPPSSFLESMARLGTTQEGFAHNPFFPNAERLSRCMKIMMVACVVVFIGEFIFALFANSIACIADTLRNLSDFLSHVCLRVITGENIGKLQWISFCICVILIWMLSGVIVYVATNRILNGIFEIEANMMIVAAVFSLTNNCILLYMHFGRKLRPRTYVALSDFVIVRIHQMLHIIGNHGTSLIILVAAVLLTVQPEWVIIEPISAYILVFLTVANTTAIVERLHSTFKAYITRRGGYTNI